jgi:hypothetical protein
MNGRFNYVTDAAVGLTEKVIDQMARRLKWGCLRAKNTGVPVECRRTRTQLQE